MNFIIFLFFSFQKRSQKASVFIQQHGFFLKFVFIYVKNWHKNGDNVFCIYRTLLTQAAQRRRGLEATEGGQAVGGPPPPQPPQPGALQVYQK
jgi:hypothetical protein